jgi:hypothetical protein
MLQPRNKLPYTLPIPHLKPFFKIALFLIAYGGYLTSNAQVRIQENSIVGRQGIWWWV